MTNISVVICCHNSSSRIERTLIHIAEQKINDLKCEVIIVDNNCTDDTVEISKSIWKKCNEPFELRIIKEPQPGLSNARKTGVNCASGEIVIFCDDDNWLDPAYVTIAFSKMKSNDRIGVLAGQGIVVANSEIPNWFYTNYGYYACGVLSLNSGDVTSRKWVWGAGMVLRKKIFEDMIKAGFTTQLSDRNGASLSSGGDVEICYWHIMTGYRLWYEEKMIYKHFMEDNRLTKEYFLELNNGIGSGFRMIMKYEKFLDFKQSARIKKILYFSEVLKNVKFYYGLEKKIRNYLKLKR